MEACRNSPIICRAFNVIANEVHVTPSQLGIATRNLNSILADADLVSLPLPQHITEFFQRAPIELVLLPQIRRQETVGVAYSHERSFECIFKSLCRASGGGIDILDAGELKETFDGGRGDETGSAGGRDELCNASISGLYLH